MDPRRHFIEDSGCELYHRGSYGHGCEIDRWPYSANPANYPNFMPPLAGKGPPRSAIPSSTLPPSKSTVVTVTGPTVPTSTPFDPAHSIFGPKISRPYLPPPVEPKFRPQKPILPPWNTPPFATPWSGPNVTYQSRKHDKSTEHIEAISIIDITRYSTNACEFQHVT